MKQIKIYLLISILTNFAIICSGFVFGQFDGELVDGMKLYISIDFIGAPNKYLLQAIDSKGNILSIKTSKTFFDDNYKLIINFNGMSCNVSSDGRRSHNIFYLYIKFVFKQNNLYQYNHLLLSNIQKVSNNSNNNKNIQINSLLDWPNVGDLDKMSNQTKIWFGYSNRSINNDDNNRIIIGCIYWLDVNDKPIELIIKGDNFYNYCKIYKDVTDSICDQYGNCKNESIDYSNLYANQILDCKSGLLEMNTAKHCYQDLSNNNNNKNKRIDLLNSYERIDNDTKSIIVKLAWITEQSINQCLMEIITSNALIEIYLNSHNQIILAIEYDKSIIWSKHILYEISSNQIHILRIEFTESNSVFKVFNGHFIKTMILPQLGLVKLINVGLNFGNHVCQQLKNKFDFRYNFRQFRPLNESNIKQFYGKCFKKTRQETKVHSWIIFLIMMISVSCLILIFIGWIIGKIKKQKEDISVSTLNIYEEPIEMKHH